MFAVARDLRMTVKQLAAEMDSAEFSEWIAYHRYYQAMPNEWLQNAMLLTALIAPHTPRDKPKPSPEKFNPVEKPPQHESQDHAALLELRKQLGYDDG